MNWQTATANRHRFPVPQTLTQIITNTGVAKVYGGALTSSVTPAAFRRGERSEITAKSPKAFVWVVQSIVQEFYHPQTYS
jgi:hypothetical protein